MIVAAQRQHGNAEVERRRRHRAAGIREGVEDEVLPREVVEIVVAPHLGRHALHRQPRRAQAAFELRDARGDAHRVLQAKLRLRGAVKNRAPSIERVIADLEKILEGSEANPRLPLR